MTTNVFSVLNTAKVGLLAQQLAIEVTGQNIANVQTEGYSRQEINFEAKNARHTSLGQIGTGVRVVGVKRAHDKFLFSQIYTGIHIFTLLELFPSSFFAFDLMLKFGLT